jgi:hypothetical protein
MKKPLLLFTSLFMAAASYAQITITSADVVTAGNTFIQATDDDASNLVIGAGGANKTWVYTAVTADQIDTMNVVLPSATPYGGSFPSSNLAMAINGSNPGYYYIISNSSSLQADGFAEASLGVIDVNPNELLVSLPATYGTNYSSTSSFSVKLAYPSPPFDSIRLKSTTVKTASFDAYGSLTVPAGTYNTIRTREVKLVTDSVFVRSAGPIPPAGWSFAQESKDTVYHYAWYANGVGTAVFEMDSSAGDMTTAKFLLMNPGPTSIATTVKAADSNLYPNPATTSFTYMNAGSSSSMLSIYDVAGNFVKSVTIQTGANQVSLDNFSAGIYFYNVSDKDGAVVKTGKFVVTK